MQHFVLSNGLGKFLQITSQGLQWVEKPDTAYKYPSKYAAKRHMKQIDDENLKVIELTEG